MKEPEVDISALVKSRTAFYLDRRSVLWEMRYAPNLISLSRILLIIPICVYYADPSPTAHWIAFGLLVLSYLSDYADGVVARRFGQQSALGLILDPLADKIWTLSMLILLVSYRDLTLWIALVIVARDLAILYLNGRILRRVGIVMPSDGLGKAYMIALGLVIIAMTLRIERAIWGAYLMIPFAGITFGNYYQRYRGALRSSPEKPIEAGG